ncbi:MAG TPA: cysteine peptidase family C39 domain-containing protein [Candidatus Limnocylindria bacterium]|nr:cysteine peptidase family C39 domain-containing protein [Candidatus Limnocylindria bacterium]
MTFGAVVAVVLAAATPRPPVLLPVPIVAQAPERCGPAALGMVLRYYGAGDSALAEAERAYDPALRGALITDLAAAARRGGFVATVTTSVEDSLRAWLAASVPPVLLYSRGIGPVTRGHYGVLVGWDPAAERYVVHDGRRKPRSMSRDDLMRRWQAAGSHVLLVRRRSP